MNLLHHPGFTSGRIFLYTLAPDADLLQEIANSCTDRGIITAVFYLTGTLSQASFGTYDIQQQVYVTQTEDTALEIISSMGTITFKDKIPLISASISVADKSGRIIGGRLFSPSHGIAVEIMLHELIGPALHRTYDALSGLSHWPTDNQTASY